MDLREGGSYLLIIATEDQERQLRGVASGKAQLKTKFVNNKELCTLEIFLRGPEFSVIKLQSLSNGNICKTN